MFDPIDAGCVGVAARRGAIIAVRSLLATRDQKGRWRRWVIDAPDSERHGCRDEAYMDVFTACPARRSSTAIAY